MTTFNSIFKSKQILPYIMMGDGGFHESHRLLDLYVSQGAKILEVGLPFSDPSADGPIIQKSAERALTNKYSTCDYIEFIKEAQVKYPHIKLILMSYLNPLLRYGIDKFLSQARPHGLIIPDVPLEEYNILTQHTAKYDIPIIPLITIDSDINRIKDILSHSGGFVYVVSMKGTTGTKKASLSSTKDLIHKIKGITNLPIVAGFGIQTSEQVQSFFSLYDGVIIASELIRLNQAKEENKIIDILSNKKTAI